MEDWKIRKLARRLKDEKLAAALVRAGLDNPRKIREANEAELERVPGVGKVKAKAVRAKFRKR